MSGTRDELVKSWLVKASRDILSAHELASAQESLLDSAAYHCQQAAEKAIKGYLLYHDVRFEKTHDIVLLLAQATDIDSQFADFADGARLLAPLAVEFRYPGNFLEPEREEFQEAYESAQAIYTFILARLPESSRP